MSTRLQRCFGLACMLRSRDRIAERTGRLVCSIGLGSSTAFVDCVCVCVKSSSPAPIRIWLERPAELQNALVPSAKMRHMGGHINQGTLTIVGVIAQLGQHPTCCSLACSTGLDLHSTCRLRPQPEACRSWCRTRVTLPSCNTGRALQAAQTGTRHSIAQAPPAQAPHPVTHTSLAKQQPQQPPPSHTRQPLF